MLSQWSLGLAVLALLSLNFSQISALKAQYCSHINTSGGSGNSSMFQSNGLCYNFCASDAYAIVQGSNCWCSNYVPDSTTSITNCNVECPGYPDDLCGNESAGLFGYISIPGNSPSGTAGSGASGGASSRTVSSTPSNTFTPTLASPSTTTSSSSSSTTWTPTPVTQISTIAGSPVTITVTPTIPPNSPNTAPISSKKKSSGLSVGGAVGLTIGLVALVALVCAILFFCWRRRQKELTAEVAGDESRRTSSAGLGGPIPSRTMSENSRYVLNTDGRQVVESYEPEHVGKRTSRLMPVDPRLNPHAPLYQRGENKSRESVNTIRDDHDYSRRVHQSGPILRATNPDD